MMERYREYKESGVKWLGEIPSHWEVVPLRKYLKINTRRNMPEAQLLSVTREEGVIVRNVESKEENHNYIPDDLSNYKYVQRGQFVINKMKSWQGSYGVSNYDGIVSPAYFVYDLNYPNKDYFNIAIRSKIFSPFFSKYSKGIRVDQWDLTPEALKIIPFLEPPKAEQDAIVRYLDSATSEIDKAIAKQQKMIDLLNERKQIIIQNAVTKGLDENVEMKESGVEWIGKIPKHWEVRRGKFLFRVVNEYSTTGQEELLTVSDRTGITPRSMKNVNMFMSESLIGYKKCQKGDICSNIMWMWHGAVGVTKYNGVISPSYGVYRQIAVNYDNKYLDYMLRLPRLVDVYGICSTGLTESRLRLYPDDFMNIQFFIPPVEEQKSIVLQIQKQITDIEKSIRNAENLITLLQERKQIIINEVVTGKVRVS